MKEWATSVIGMAFGLSMIVFFGMGKIPLEVFAPIATACILWFFREREMARLLKSIQSGLRIKVLKRLEDKLKI
jgi:hypothetical protein